jgi:glycosyltransferase involved in cell wall biosynthesis
VAWGAWKLPWVENFAPAADDECARVSLIFAARDEEEKLPGALAKLAALNYPNLEIIAVDDRSTDSTGRILDDFARANARFRVVHVRELPPRWLGKPHALQKAYEASSGEWLLFTDADVHFKPDVLRRAMTLAKTGQFDHVSLLCELEIVGFWEKVLIPFFAMFFYLSSDPYRASDPHSVFYVGIGAFQMVKRAAYARSGTHRRLAMEVIDDMKLGKIVKQAGFRSGVGIARDHLSVRWHAGVGNLVRGVTKNFFAGAGYNVWLVGLAVTGMLLMNIGPVVAAFFGHGWIRWLAAIALVIGMGFQATVAATLRVSPLYALTQPVGAVLLSYSLLRSTVVTLRQGGIVWRDTFYPLEELKRGLV